MLCVPGSNLRSISELCVALGLSVSRHRVRHCPGGRNCYLHHLIVWFCCCRVRIFRSQSGPDSLNFLPQLTDISYWLMFFVVSMRCLILTLQYHQVWGRVSCEAKRSSVTRRLHSRASTLLMHASHSLIGVIPVRVRALGTPLTGAYFGTGTGRWVKRMEGLSGLL